MSSFSISLKDYQRVAGVFGYFSREKFHDQVMFYNYVEHRPLTEVEIQEDFKKLYKINYMSVMLQYKDFKMLDLPEEEDAHAYCEGIHIAQSAYLHGKMEKLIACVRKFFSSVKYQIEDSKLTREAADIINYYFVNLCALMEDPEGICWGDFNKEEIEEFLKI